MKVVVGEYGNTFVAGATEDVCVEAKVVVGEYGITFVVGDVVDVAPTVDDIPAVDVDAVVDVVTTVDVDAVVDVGEAVKVVVGEYGSTFVVSDELDIVPISERGTDGVATKDDTAAGVPKVDIIPVADIGVGGGDASTKDDPAASVPSVDVVSSVDVEPALNNEFNSISRNSLYEANTLSYSFNFCFIFLLLDVKPSVDVKVSIVLDGLYGSYDNVVVGPELNNEFNSISYNSLYEANNSS